LPDQLWKAPRVPILAGDDRDGPVRAAEIRPVPEVAGENLLDLGDLRPPDGIGRVDDDG
jgi:hypothetical protein